jgi:DNA-binding CsgD family transcriptional regulator
MDELMNFVQCLAQTSTVADLEATYLREVGRILPLPMHGVYHLDPVTRTVDRYAAANVSDIFLSRYEQIGRTEDPIIAHVLSSGTVGYSLGVMSRDGWLRSTVYQEVFSLHGMVHAAQAPVFVGDEIVGTLAFGGDEGRDELSIGELARIKFVARAFGLALAAVERLEDSTRRIEQVGAALDLCATPVAILSSTAEPQLNAAARRLLDRAVEGRQLLYRLIAAPAGHEGSFSRQASVRWVDGGEGTVRAHSRLSGGDAGGLITVLESDRVDPPLVGPRWTRLTAREREVVELLFRGLPDNETADRLHLSPYTVKQYAKSVYRKAGVRSRVELAGVALGERSAAG